MAIIVDWSTLTFSVPQADLTLVSGTLYDMDTEVDYRQQINAIMDDEDGIVFEDPINHNTEVTIAGVTYARLIEQINGYSLTFTPDTQWTVRYGGSNNNLFDVENGILNQNQVQVISANSAGLQIVASGSGLSAAQDAKLTNIDTRATATDRAIRNRYIINRTTGMIDIYNDASSSIIDSVPIYEDQDAATPVGATITRIDRREKIDI